jgi:hypothetical protein
LTGVARELRKKVCHLTTIRALSVLFRSRNNSSAIFLTPM